MASKYKYIDTGDNTIPVMTFMSSESKSISVDFSREATRRGATTSSATWSIDKGSGISISNTGLASSIASARLASGNNGSSALVKVSLTFSDGTVRVKKLMCSVESAQLSDDYCE